MEMIMRFSPAALSAALILVSFSSASQGEVAKQIVLNPASVAFVDEGRNEQQAGRTQNAINLYESALAIDPRNVDAYRLLAEAAMAQGLSGKAIGYYIAILDLMPNDREALAGQGRAMVQKGAMERARENLTRLRTLCKTGSCPEVARLEAAIAAGPPQQQLAIEAIRPKPVGSESDPSKN